MKTKLLNKIENIMAKGEIPFCHNVLLQMCQNVSTRPLTPDVVLEERTANNVAKLIGRDSKGLEPA